MVLILFQEIKDGIDDKKIHEKKGKSVVSDSLSNNKMM